MLRVGLTGELGSGKSTVARIFGELGALLLSSDALGREMMQPGEPVYQAIIARFGPDVAFPNGALNRRSLAKLAFDPDHPRVEELNALVHPAVIAEQERRIEVIARENPDAIVVVESALLFTTRHAGGNDPWRRRFDRIVVVTAPDEVKLARVVERSAAGSSPSSEERAILRSDAIARLAAQRSALPSDGGLLSIDNDSDLAHLRVNVERIWKRLQGRLT